MKCPNCSFFNEVRAEVCKICGTKLEKKIRNVTNTLSLDQALREKYMPSSASGASETTTPSEAESSGTPAWELIPGLLVASSPRTQKIPAWNTEDAPGGVAADMPREDCAHSEPYSDSTSGGDNSYSEPHKKAEAIEGASDSREGEVEDMTDAAEAEVASETTEVVEEDPTNDDKDVTVAEAEVASEVTEVVEEDPTSDDKDVTAAEDTAEEEPTEKLAYIPPVYESLTGFERIDIDAPPIVIPNVEEYDVPAEENNEEEYVDTITKSSRDRWIIAIIVFLCILLVVLGAIIVRILWQWWHHDDAGVATTTPRRTTPTITSSLSTTPETTTNSERANPVIGQFTYDLQSYLVSSKTDFLAYMLNPMDAKMKLSELHSIGVTRTEVEEIKYQDGVLLLDTWVFNAVDGKAYKRLVKWEFDCAIGEYIDVKDFKHDFVLAEDEQKRVETKDEVITTENTSIASGGSNTATTEASTEATSGATTQATTQRTTITTTAAAPTTTFDDSYFVKSGSVSGGTATESDSLSKMRMGDHGYFQRLVFDFLGEKAPVYTASIDDGGYTLNLYLSNMTGHSEQPEIASWSTMTSIEVFSNSADSLQVQMRFSEPIMINTFTIDEPGRIVIDVRGDSNWDTPQ